MVNTYVAADCPGRSTPHDTSVFAQPFSFLLPPQWKLLLRRRFKPFRLSLISSKDAATTFTERNPVLSFQCPRTDSHLADLPSSIISPAVSPAFSTARVETLIPQPVRQPTTAIPPKQHHRHHQTVK